MLNVSDSSSVKVFLTINEFTQKFLKIRVSSRGEESNFDEDNSSFYSLVKLVYQPNI